MSPTRPHRLHRLGPPACALTAVAALAGPVAPAAAERVYGGDKASERLELAMAVSDDGAAVTRASIASELVCGDYRRVDTATSTAITALRVDATLVRARPRGAGRTDTATARLRGELGTGRGEGTLTLTSRITENATGRVLRTCSRRFPWRVGRNPGRLYAGNTSQGGPVVVRISADRRRITATRYAWVATCRRVEYYFEPHDDYLLPFRLGSGGTFSQPFRYDAGLRRDVIGRFGGRLTAARGSGRLRVRMAGGGERCRTPDATWTVTTG
jgi:hypothetical protein